MRELALGRDETLRVTIDPEFPDLTTGTVAGPGGTITLWRDSPLGQGAPVTLPDGRHLRIEPSSRQSVLEGMALGPGGRMRAWVDGVPVTADAHPYVKGWRVVGMLLFAGSVAFTPLMFGAVAALLWSFGMAAWVDWRGARDVPLPPADRAPAPGPAGPFEPPRSG